jgi:hypothetical protein
MTRLGSDDALRYILANLRERDRAEIKATNVEGIDYNDAVPHFFSFAAFKTIAYDKQDNPAAFMMFHPMTPVTLAASMLATDKWLDVASPLMRWGLKFFKPQALEVGYRRCECRTLAGHHEAIWMLERLGFRQEAVIPDYGSNSETFLQFAWRASDHVHLFQSKNAKNAGAAKVASERGRVGDAGQCASPDGGGKGL